MQKDAGIGNVGNAQTVCKAQELEDLECIRGKQSVKLQCCLQSRLLVESPEPEFLREPLPTLYDFEVVLRPQYSDRVPGIGISAATQPNASAEYLRWLAVRRSLHRT